MNEVSFYMFSKTVNPFQTLFLCLAIFSGSPSRVCYAIYISLICLALDGKHGQVVIFMGSVTDDVLSTTSFIMNASYWSWLILWMFCILLAIAGSTTCLSLTKEITTLCYKRIFHFFNPPNESQCIAERWSVRGGGCPAWRESSAKSTGSYFAPVFQWQWLSLQLMIYMIGITEVNWQCNASNLVSMSCSFHVCNFETWVGHLSAATSALVIMFVQPLHPSKYPSVSNASISMCNPPNTPFFHHMCHVITICVMSLPYVSCHYHMCHVITIVYI